MNAGESLVLQQEVAELRRELADVRRRLDRFYEDQRAILRLTEKVRTDGEGPCGICGCRKVRIRARYPDGDHRIVCPTCLADRLENVREMATEPRAQARPTGGEGQGE